MLKFKQSEKALRRIGEELLEKFRYIIAIVFVVAGFYMASSFFLTLDKIQEPLFRILYILTVAALIVIATVLIFGGLFGRAKKSSKDDKPIPRVRLHPSSGQVFERTEGTGGDAPFEMPFRFPARADPVPAQGDGETGVVEERTSGQRLVFWRGATRSDDFKIAVVFPPSGGEDPLVDRLTVEIAARGAADARWSRVGLARLPAVTEDDAAVRQALSLAAAADLVLFVFEHDLLRHETDALRGLLAGKTPVILVLNRIDRLRDREAGELEASIRAKLADLRRRPHIITAMPDPLPQRLVLIGADGSETVEYEAPAHDLSALVDAVDKAMRAAR